MVPPILNAALPHHCIGNCNLKQQVPILNFLVWVLQQVKKRGFSVFLMPAGMLGTLLALWDVLPIFSNSGWGEGSNIAFLQSHMGIEFSKRPQPWVTDVNTAEIHSGDFLALSKIRGRWGGFETLEKWVTGAQAGHTAVCLRDEDDKLWVGESGHQNEAVQSFTCILVPTPFFSSLSSFLETRCQVLWSSVLG